MEFFILSICPYLTGGYMITAYSEQEGIVVVLLYAHFPFSPLSLAKIQLKKKNQQIKTLFLASNVICVCV